MAHPKNLQVFETTVIFALLGADSTCVIVFEQRPSNRFPQWSSNRLHCVAEMKASPDK